MPYLYQVSASTRKFWQIEQQGETLHTLYGRIGSEGTVSRKRYDNAVQAQADLQKQMRQKIGKGYLFPIPRANPQPEAWPAELTAAMPPLRGVAVAPYQPSLQALVLAYGYQNRLFFSVESQVRELDTLVRQRLAGEPGTAPVWLDDPAAWEEMLWVILSSPTSWNFYVSNSFEVYRSLATAGLLLLGAARFLPVWLSLMQRLQDTHVIDHRSFMPFLHLLRHGVASLPDHEQAAAADCLRHSFEHPHANFGLRALCIYLLGTESDWSQELTLEYQQIAPLLQQKANLGDYADRRNFQSLRSNASLLLYCAGRPGDHLWLYENTFSHYDEAMQAVWLRLHDDDSVGLFTACLRKFEPYLNESAARRDARSTCLHLLTLGSARAVRTLCRFMHYPLVVDILAVCCVQWPLFMQNLLLEFRREFDRSDQNEAMRVLSAHLRQVLDGVPQDMAAVLQQLGDAQAAAAQFDAQVSALRTAGRIKAKAGSVPPAIPTLSKAARSLLPVVRGLHVPEQTLTLQPLQLEYGIAYRDLQPMTVGWLPLQAWLENGSDPQQLGPLSQPSSWSAIFRTALQLLAKTRMHGIHVQLCEQAGIVMRAALTVLGAEATLRVFMPELRDFVTAPHPLEPGSLLEALSVLRHALALLPEAEHAALRADILPPAQETELEMAVVVQYLFAEQADWCEALLMEKLQTAPAAAVPILALLQSCACPLPQAIRLHSMAALPWSESEVVLRILENGTKTLPLFASWLAQPDTYGEFAEEGLLRKFLPTIPSAASMTLLAGHLQLPAARQLLADMALLWPEPVREAVFSQSRPAFALYLLLQLLA
ncbi:MAG: WGR domain-containing protein [Fluviicoccus sp.]|uniref:WGR domain-containing protein n=1 Tax=Fluviicoccus sp. TaxID=2003552 RepID=UPI00271A5CF3|nr:WGR domain-containing protein [Fluviicoccus sp.]MDO8332146.1 WGR domain-containing protein [Fluviicoccus sp.]